MSWYHNALYGRRVGGDKSLDDMNLAYRDFELALTENLLACYDASEQRHVSLGELEFG
jgi:hypothetical protein